MLLSLCKRGMRNGVGSANFSLLGKEQMFFGSERAVCTSDTPEAHIQGPCMEEHPSATSTFGVLTQGFLPPQLFLGKCQDNASRTTVSSKLVIFGETQV